MCLVGVCAVGAPEWPCTVWIWKQNPFYGAYSCCVIVLLCVCVCVCVSVGTVGAAEWPSTVWIWEKILLWGSFMLARHGPPVKCVINEWKHFCPITWFHIHPFNLEWKQNIEILNTHNFHKNSGFSWHITIHPFFHSVFSNCSLNGCTCLSFPQTRFNLDVDVVLTYIDDDHPPIGDANLH